MEDIKSGAAIITEERLQVSLPKRLDFVINDKFVIVLLRENFESIHIVKNSLEFLDDVLSLSQWGRQKIYYA
jgi:hypothetical protein